MVIERKEKAKIRVTLKISQVASACVPLSGSGDEMRPTLGTHDLCDKRCLSVVSVFEP